MAENNNSAMVGALMLVAGGIIGAGVALLFAPQSGKRTRKEIALPRKRSTGLKRRWIALAIPSRTWLRR